MAPAVTEFNYRWHCCRESPKYSAHWKALHSFFIRCVPAKWFPGQKQLVTKTHKRTILDPIYSPVYFIKLKNCIIANNMYILEMPSSRCFLKRQLPHFMNSMLYRFIKSSGVLCLCCGVSKNISGQLASVLRIANKNEITLKRCKIPPNWSW